MVQIDISDLDLPTATMIEDDSTTLKVTNHNFRSDRCKTFLYWRWTRTQ